MLINIRGARQEHNIDNLPVDANAMVSELRRSVAARLHVDDASRMRLVYSGRLLDDAQPVSFYNIQDGHVVHVVVSTPASPSATGTNTTTTNTPTPNIANAFTFSSPQASEAATAVFSSVAPTLTVVQEAFQSQPIGAAISSLLTNALLQQAAQQQQVQPQQPPVTGFPTGGLGGLSGLTNATVTSTTTMAPAATAAAPTSVSPVPGFPQAARSAPAATATAASATSASSSSPAAAPAAQATPQPNVAAHPAVSRGIPLAQTAPVQNVTFTTTNTTAAPASALAGVYVHIHCDLSELDQVPARIQALQQRMATPQVIFQAHATPQQAAQPQPQPVLTQVRVTVPATTTPSTTAAAAAEGTTARTMPAGHIVANIPPTRREALQRWFGPLSPLTTDTPLLLPLVLSSVAQRIGMAGVPALMSGNWGPVAQQRGFLAAVMQSYYPRYTPANLTLDQVAAREGYRLYEQVWSQESTRRLVAQEQRPEMGVVDPTTGRTPLQSEFLSYLVTLHSHLMSAVHLQDHLNDAEWALGVRGMTRLLVGAAYHRSPRWFRDGPAGLTRILLQSLEVIVTQPASGAGTNPASLAMMMPLLRMSLPQLFQSWTVEYERSALRSPSDENIFTIRFFPEESTAVAPATTTTTSTTATTTAPTTAAATATTTPSGEAGLLDDALDELLAAPAAQADTQGQRLQAAVAQWADAASVSDSTVHELNDLIAPDLDSRPHS